MTSSASTIEFRDRDDGVVPTDCQIIAVIRNGDVAAFDVLVDRHYDSLVRPLTARTADQEVALDIAQETFADAFRDLDTFDGRGTVAVWLYGIAHNRLRMHWRRQRLRRLISLDWLTGAGTAPPLALRQADGNESCHERDLIARVLGELSPPLRDALLLHSLDGFTAPEVADILHISRSAAERRVSRAKEQFRKRYRGLDRDDGDIAGD